MTDLSQNLTLYSRSKFEYNFDISLSKSNSIPIVEGILRTILTELSQNLTLYSRSKFEDNFDRSLSKSNSIPNVEGILRTI